jgi:D-alanyl-D-alanine carboxypeptidase
LHFWNRRPGVAVWGGLFALVLTLGASLALPQPAEAAARKRTHVVRHAPPLRGTGLKAGRRRVVRMPASPTDPDKDAALVIDGLTGKVLYARNENVERHPASLTKMMTLYLLFEALKKGQVTMETQMPVSVHASVQKPTKLSLRPGTTISVDTAIRAIVIRSANDVAVVIAEALGGTEGHFAEMMTEKGRQLGMRETNYHNASGLPDPLQITTATDLSVLARHLAYDFPQYFPYFALSGFNYKGSWYPTHDNLIGRYQGADGIKTGYTGASGFNLVSSVTRGNIHVIGIVMGGRTAIRRDLEMVRILDNTFNQIAANPTLVAQGPVPWRNAQPGGGAPAIAGFTLLPQVAAPGSKFAALSPLPKSAPAQVEDEDAAENAHAADEDVSIIHADTPAVPTAAQMTAQSRGPANAISPPVAVAAGAPLPPSSRSPLPVKVAGPPPPAIRPSPRPAHEAQVAANVPKPGKTVDVPRPQLRPARTDNESTSEGEGDASGPAPAPGHDWTIQIGAYADQTLAKAQLALYAQRSMDVLGQADRIIAPLQSEGHTIYRARFGLFAEREARDVCNRLTQRGQTCFAAVATR